MKSKNKILVSACLLGQCVRYNATHCQVDHKLLTRWQKEDRLIPVCPEVMSGLPTPRPSAEIDQTTDQVMTENGKNVTAAFAEGAQQVLEIAKNHDVKLAVLKQYSPSCGSREIYDGTFQGNRIAGQGVTAKLLQEHGIQIIGEDELDDLV